MTVFQMANFIAFKIKDKRKQNELGEHSTNTHISYSVHLCEMSF